MLLFYVLDSHTDALLFCDNITAENISNYAEGFSTSNCSSDVLNNNHLDLTDNIRAISDETNTIEDISTNILLSENMDTQDNTYDADFDDVMLPVVTESADTVYNVLQLNRTYNVIDIPTTSANKTYVGDAMNSLSMFTPLAESTLLKQVSNPECIDNIIDTESLSIASERDTDSSFRLSDCSAAEDTDEDSDMEDAIDTSGNKTDKSSINLTSSLCSSKIDICDDRNMYVDTSHNSKVKRNFCLFCKKLQTQLTRHLETVHKNEDEVKKFCLLPKGK